MMLWSAACGPDFPWRLKTNSMAAQAVRRAQLRHRLVLQVQQPS